ncbi:MAG: hydroxyethylthiazole kinase [Thermoplasmata archaeon]|nr:hydroxyethylthiazole kinase [Thermoplasmata archaeon]
MSTAPSEFMAKVRQTTPLVHHITNYVTVNDCANVCICAGGSPVMTDAIEDIDDMVSIASATVLNIGTLNERTVDSMVAAADCAAAVGIPMILDPVGAGATAYRTSVAEALMDLGPSVIKGNAGEIGVLSGLGGDVKGVDSHGSQDAAEAARSLAERMGCIVVATGEVDYVSDGQVTLRLSNGCGLLGKVSGTGCMLSSVVGCYAGACGASVESMAAAISAFNVAAEIASGNCRGPGTFKPALLDALDSLDAATLDSKARCEQL